MLLSQVAVKGFKESDARFELNSIDISLDPRKAPKHGWRFTHRIDVLGRPVGTQESKPLFRIYSQSQATSAGTGVNAGRLLARLWDFVQGTLRLKHPPAYGDGVIDVYLCDGGAPGGEQLLGREVLGGRVRNFNAIFVFQVGTLTEPLEAARELAHEYGHAVLPAVGGFVEPEDWGNGYLGERLFLDHLRVETQAGRLPAEDTMGADSKMIGEFCRKEVDPSLSLVAKSGPNVAALRAKGPKALEAYLGVMMYLRTVLDDDTFARVLVLSGSRAHEVLAGVSESLNLGEAATLRMPSAWLRTPVWIPLPKGWKASETSAVKRNGAWVQIQPTTTSIRIFKAQRAP